MNNPAFRIGHGFDIHALADNRDLILGGIKIPYNRGLIGHSDADCLIHALSDAILGALSLPDIGNYFPDNDPANKDLDSTVILKKVRDEAESLGYCCSNIDLTIIAQEPKLSPFIQPMKNKIGEILRIAPNYIGIKSTTHERLGSLGRAEGIATHAVCLLSKIRS